MIESDEISLNALEALNSFCPCNLKNSPTEHQFLIDLFFNQAGPFASEAGSRRQQTLTLVLELIDHLTPTTNKSYGNLDLVGTFRSCVYAGVLPDGKEWRLPAHLEKQLTGWRVYQTHELLSVAVQTIFWTALDRLEMEGGLTRSRQHFGDWFVSQFARHVLGSSANSQFGSVVESIRHTLPHRREWTHAEHEMDAVWNLLGLPFDQADKQTHVQATKFAIHILLALAARQQAQSDPYDSWLDRPEHQLSFYPINLVSFRTGTSQIWKNLTMTEWLFWLITNWGLDVHFKVALRKLRAELKDTFRIRPTDDGLRVIGAIKPDFTRPRLSQAIQILWDLKMIDTDSEKMTASLTHKGRQLLEAGRA